MKKLSIIFLISSSIFVSVCTGQESTKLEVNQMDNIKSIESSEQELEKDYNELINSITDVLYPFYDINNGKFGYMDKLGNEILRPQFDIADFFTDGYAIEDNRRVINNKGEFEVNLTNNGVES